MEQATHHASIASGGARIGRYVRTAMASWRSVDDRRWDLVYDLRADEIGVREIQEWSLHRPGFGFPPTPWLYGSDRWWAAVASGELETRELAATIERKVRWDPYGDNPTFEVRDGDDILSWPFPGGDATRYAEGLAIRIRFARCERKADAPAGLSRTANVILRIWIAEQP